MDDLEKASRRIGGCAKAAHPKLLPESYIKRANEQEC